MLKHWRLLILIVCILSSLLAIGFKAYPYGRNGVEIVYISESSPAWGILEQNMIITEINGNPIKNVDDWNGLITNLTGSVTLIANAKDYKFNVNETVGIDVMNIERTNLDFGLDLRGGTRIILKPEGNITKSTIDQIISTLQTRANIYGLKEMTFQPVSSGDNYYIQIEAAGIGSEIINNLLSRQGSFEAKVLKPVYLETNNSGNLVLGSNEYPVKVLNEEGDIEINNTIIESNQTFQINEISFQYINKTQNNLYLMASVFEGDDIELVYTDPQRSGVIPRGNVYSFYFTVLISEDGAKKFADITKGIKSYLDIQSGDEYLDSMIYLYLDNQLVSELRIGASLGGHLINTPQIQGSRLTREEAIEEKLHLQTILRSGALPTTLETMSVDIISPTLGAGFFTSAGYAIGLAAIVVIVIVFVRYRSLKISLPLVFVGLSEVIIILGIAAKNDTGIWGTALIINFCILALAWWKKYDIDVYAWIGAILIPLLGLMTWTIDLPAIGGIIAAIGTGVDHQIIIADETVKGEKEKRVYTVKEKIKRAFFIIFGAAATTIAAMVPLMFLGIGLVRGFAITTIIGVLVGVLITRPAYAKIIESIFKK